MLWILDRIVVPTALVAAFIRFGNLMNSEIYGIQTTLPWGFIFERNGETVAKHPTQLYEAFSYLIAFVVLTFMYWKTRSKYREGLIFGIILYVYFWLKIFYRVYKRRPGSV